MTHGTIIQYVHDDGRTFIIIIIREAMLFSKLGRQ
jgi:hypothetical protein